LLLGSTGYTEDVPAVGLDGPVVGFAAELFALLFVLACLFKAKPLTWSTVDRPPKMFEKPLLRLVEDPLPAWLLIALLTLA
jgi:hypothetical protein